MSRNLPGPSSFPWSQSIAASGTFEPLASWVNETPDADVMIEVLERATAVGLVSSISSGQQFIKQEAPVQAGGTAGTTPNRQNTEPVTGRGTAFAKLRVFYRNPTAGAITVDGVVNLVPLGGGRGRR